MEYRRKNKTYTKKNNFLRDLKEEGILKIVWKKGSDNKVDMFTKNLAGLDFAECSADFVSGMDIEYSNQPLNMGECWNVLLLSRI